MQDLRRRIAATRWTSGELVADRSQGVQLATIKELARYWATEHDWRKCEEKLNALPQFKTEIDGMDVHFIHVKSRHENALPWIITHGWPGPVIELLDVVGPLTGPDRARRTCRGRVRPGAALAARLRLPPRRPRSAANPGRVARPWAELMHRLDYMRYVAQGGDQGAALCDTMGGQAPEGLLCVHNYPSRLGLAEGEAEYDQFEQRLGEGPVSMVPTITLEGDANGAPLAGPSAYEAMFSGKYSRRTIDGGTGYNLPQEAREAFAEAIVDVDGAT